MWGPMWGQVFNLDILKEIADYLGIHYTTVSKVIKKKIYKK
jgi:DNA-binding MarR family transcriptional regulator